MNAPVDIGVGCAGLIGDCINHRIWLLRTRGIVQIDQRLAVHLTRQDRKFCPNGVYVQRPAHDSANQLLASSRKISFRSPAVSTASAMKASVNRARAVRSGMPR